MKSRLFTIFVLMTALCGSTFAQSLYVGTYNLRCPNQGDDKAGNGWAVRGEKACQLMNFEQPDAFGTQELTIGQIKDALRYMPDYKYIGVARDDGKEKGEHAAIFYNTKRVKLLRDGNFWLNETPDVPAKGWDAACVRICTWGQFKLKDKKFKFYYFNLHMDHVGVVARAEAAKLVVKKIKEITKGAPVILTGDFNVDQNNEIFKTFSESGFLKDAYVDAKQRFAPNGTFNSFNPTLSTDSRIDHVFLSPKFEVNHYGVLTCMYWTPNENVEDQKGKDAPSEINFQEYITRTPSDHYPVLTKIKFQKKNKK